MVAKTSKTRKIKDQAPDAKKNKEGVRYFLRPTRIISYLEFLAIYKSKEWTKIGRWPLPNLSKCIFGDAMSYSRHYLEYGMSHENLTYFDIDGETLYPVSEVSFLESTYGDLVIKKDFAWFERYLKKQDSLRRSLTRKIAAIVKTRIDDPKFYSLLCDLLSELYKLVATFNFALLADALEKAIGERLKELGMDDVFLPQLLEQDKESDTGKLHLETERLAALVRQKKIKTSSPGFRAKLKRLSDRFGYINTYFLSSRPYSPEDIRVAVEKSAAAEAPAHAKKIIIKDSLLKKQVWLLNSLAVNKLVRFEVVMKVLHELEPQIAEMAKRVGKTKEEICELYMDEFLDFVESGYKKISSKTGFKRAGFVCKDEFLVLTHEDAFRFKREFLTTVDKTDILRGTPSYQGKVSGVVRVITSPSQFPDFQDGEILVCSMTDPNYVPLMKKASGIITDMGGILCHAAIVSRELKKPCIIATKIATKALKTGDTVELDAIAGIIKIIR
jgi:phosphohistidine swiveling domain-containing protein